MREKRDAFVQKSNANLIHPQLSFCIPEHHKPNIRASVINNKQHSHKLLCLYVQMKGTQCTQCNLQSNTTLRKMDS